MGQAAPGRRPAASPHLMETFPVSLTVIDGLPAHVLFVHAVVVLVPLTALLLVLCAIWPAAAHRLSTLVAVFGVLTLASVPLTTHAGEWLEAHVGRDPLVQRHAELGDGLLPWAIGLCLLSLLVWWATRQRAAATDAGDAGAAAPVSGWSKTPVRAVVAVLAVAVAVGAVVDVYRIGDSGAKAAWHDGYSKTALHHRGGDGDDEG